MPSAAPNRAATANIAGAPRERPGTGGHRIYKVRPDGTGLTPVTAGDGDGWPRWRR